MSSFRYYFIITLFILFPIQSYSFRHLFQQPHISPSPSPSYYDGSNLCSRESRSCHVNNITACLTYGTHSEMCLFVHNNGESLQHVKIRILPANNTIKELNITGYQMKEVNISSDVDLSSALALTTSDGNCVISTAAAPSPENRYQKYSSYGTYITPTNGAYLVILLLIIGGVITFYKLRTRGRHLDGVTYHELEMGNSTSVNMDENETENWDQDWDDQWDDEKPVKSSGDNHVLVKQANELITKLPNSNGRKKEWDD
ncbi:hypothetical protein M8C21_030787 [Ambrosia artemisiifolia]|uniref:DUF7356 domain-containing protein n=1 Tax=Ambrosia artemisiifolia TaxID=4212 RepID=A0AAD5GDW8_AMBAR|nr:hypothetical protein M8C21_030787 [Ambrosia artemisiifolia]